MKKGILFGALLLTLAACSSTEKMLSHGWKLKDMDFNAADFNIPAEQKATVKQKMLDNAIFEFNKDHTYIARLTGTTDTGTWSISPNKDTLYTKTGNRLTASKINVMSADLLDVNSTSGNTTIRFVLVPK